MHLQLKKVDILTLKVHIFTTPGKTLSQVPIISTQEERNHSSSQLREKTMELYFKTYCFKSNILKHVTKECTFCYAFLLRFLQVTLITLHILFLDFFKSNWVFFRPLVPADCKRFYQFKIISYYSLILSQLNKNIKFLQVCICDKQCYSFDRIYK